MAVFRVERTRDYTVMCNHHLKDSNLSLKAKGLLSMMLSLPDEWNYTTRGLAAICKEGVDAIGKTLKELELAGYIIRRQLRGKDGRISDTEYTIFEKPRKPSPPDTTLPDTENPYLDIVCVAIYAVLVQNIALVDDIIYAIWTCMGYTVLLCFCLFKTSSLAKSVFNAH